MKSNTFFKLLTLVFVFILFSLVGLANEKNTNVLTKISVEPTENNSFNFNLFFKEKYTGNTFIQNKGEGTYIVFIPDTTMNAKKTKLLYRNKKDSEIIKVGIEEKPLNKGKEQSNYVKLTVNIANDYAIRILSKVDKNQNAVSPINFANTVAFILITAGALILYILFKTIGNMRNRENTSFTYFPKSYLKQTENHTFNSISEQKTNQIITPQTINTPQNKGFSCFDVPNVKSEKQSLYEFKSRIKQTSNIMKERTSRFGQTNPIYKKYIEENSELSLPVVEDLPLDKPETEERVKREPELLSSLNVAPNKGFYLTTTDDDLFALFGFVGDSVYLLKKFDDLKQINLQARYYDKSSDNTDLYIVRMDSYKAMIEISDSGMNEMAVL